jgi:hypothetical protein
MAPRLSGHRPVQTSEDWNQVNHLLHSVPDSISDLPDPDPRPIQKPSIPPPRKPPTRHDVMHNAFQSAQTRRLELAGRIQSTTDLADTKHRVARDAKHPHTLAYSHANPLIHDSHVVERVITTRNQLYRAASAVVGRGAIPDLHSIHQLPRDTLFHAAPRHRVFFWG